MVSFNDPVAGEQPVIDPPTQRNYRPVPFGEHSTGQSKEALEKTLGLNGKVGRIFETINAAHILMDADEAQRLSRDKRIKLVQQDVRFSFAATQYLPGWGLDRLDQSTPATNDFYVYNNNGAGRTIYVLDSGLALANAGVATEFGGRASILFDFTYNQGANGGSWCGPVAVGTANGYCGQDTLGHGTAVASIAGGVLAGVAKGVTIKMIKVGNNASPYPPFTPSPLPYDNWLSSVTATLNFLAANPADAPRGTIANLSLVLQDVNCNTLVPSLKLQPAWENAVKAAYNAGIIVVVAAGNDGCNTADYSPTNIPEAFVVGASSNSLFAQGKDAIADWGGPNKSRRGTNISAFAPGTKVIFTRTDGTTIPPGGDGTSLATPYIAGLFAIACQTYAPSCETPQQPTSVVYNGLKSFGTNTVTNTDGSPFTDGTPPRFIPKPAW